MNAVEIIARKRDGHTLTEEEIDFFIQGYTQGRIPDYQASAWLMAVYVNGMNERETRDLTRAMAHSGDVLSLKGIAQIVVDKHSTGGVGDKVTLIVAPLVAASGLPVAKISGRGLGFTGGTLDKLESIPGYRTDLTDDEFRSQLEAIGIVLTGQTKTLAPADGKLYALRDVTATVGSVPLIVSSILSKKIAGGADALVLDVKTGTGALMKTLAQSRALAHALVHHGTALGLKTVALVSDMNQPLGQAVGNAIEVQEAIATLQGSGPIDLREHCLRIAAEMLLLGEIVTSYEVAYSQAESILDTGRAWDKFRQLVAAQGGDVDYVDQPERLLHAQVIRDVPAPRAGYLSAVDAALVGIAVVHLGGGRQNKGDQIDHNVGIVVHHHVGDFVQDAELLATVYANSEEQATLAVNAILAAHAFTDSPVPPLPQFYDRITV
ncbi:MAG: thymidine phosphorylase [Anaerolineae bacterium]|nr:thymidine phosphorylase [Anaerolineae bacterium]